MDVHTVRVELCWHGWHRSFQVESETSPGMRSESNDRLHVSIGSINVEQCKSTCIYKPYILGLREQSAYSYHHGVSKQCNVLVNAAFVQVRFGFLENVIGRQVGSITGRRQSLEGVPDAASCG